MSVRDNPIVKAVIDAVEPTDNVLDLCCGIGDITQHISCRQVIGVDAHKPYLDTYRLRVRGSIIIHADVLDVPTRPIEYINEVHQRVVFIPDVVLLLDAVEHLQTPETIDLLSWAESIALKKIIVFTPLGFVENHRTPPCWGIPGAEELQRHKSGYSEEFFANRGYKLVAAVTNHVSKARQNLYIREQTNGTP